MPAQLIIIGISLVLILIGAKIFTNAVEWLGKKFSLPEGAVGSLLSAVATALPETIVPVVSIFLHQGKEEIGIGAILGAPFMLATLGFFVIGVAVFIFNARTPLNLDYEVLRRDLMTFLLVYWIAIVCSFIDNSFFRRGAALFLICSYILYAKKTLSAGKCLGNNLAHLYFSRMMPPKLRSVILQLSFALLLIVAGAHIFVQNLSVFAAYYGVSPFLLSVIIAPVATELPEKFNSIFWIREKKYTMAVGNMTGAMVFQSSVIPVIGILYTPWKLEHEGLLVCLLALSSALFILVQGYYGLKKRHFLMCGAFYIVFLCSILF